MATTWWDADPSECCYSYLLFAAGSMPPTLLALIAPHSAMVASLLREID